MRGTTSACTLALFSLIVAAPGAVAQKSDHNWSKSYQISGRPTLSVETGDAHLTIRSCGDCHSIGISAEVTGQPLSEFRVEESQTGDHVTFRFKEKTRIHISLHDSRSHHATVSIEAPADIALDARTADGNVEVSGLRGELQFHTGDGGLTLQDLSGSLVLKSGDGKVRVVNFNGNLDATVSDGGITADGVFSGLSVHSTDGAVDLTARANSQTAKPWGIKSADGGVVMRLPKDLSADLEVNTNDGKIDSNLPLTIGSYSRRDRPSNGMHGRLNAGGGPITIRTTDGDVRLETE